MHAQGPVTPDHQLQSLQEDRAQDPRPIRPEDLAKQYTGRWMIGEDRQWDGTTSEWVADPCGPGDERLTARTVEQLAQQLRRATGS